MKSTKFFLLSSLVTAQLIISVGHADEPKKHFYFIGGGGEPKGDTTIFDGEIKRVGSFINSSQWDTTVSFNGGHKKTEELIKDKMGKAKNAGPFVEKNYNALMDEMIQKLEKGELSSGDQLLISIDTHGARRSSGKDAEKTHRVALAHSTASELNNLSGARTVDLDKLEKIIALAAEKKVKLGILDFSCYSGNLLNLKNDKVCMISASGPEHYSYASVGVNLGFFTLSFPVTFASKFFDNLEKGKNLEEIFIESRTTGSTPDFPMINTKEGLAVNEMLYRLITPYLNYNSNDTTNYASSYVRRGEKFEEQVCRIESNHNQLLELLKQYENVGAVTDEMGRNEFKSLAEALDEYRSYQRTYEQSLRGKFEVEKEIKEMFLKQFPNDKKAWESYAPLDFLSLDFDSSIKRYEELAERDKNKKYVAGMWDSTIQMLKKQKEITEYVKANVSENAKAKLKAQEEAFANSGVTRGLAGKVSTETKKVYELLYKRAKSAESNPCRDFVL